MTRVLITGISGFIGSCLAEKLVSKGHQVYGVIRRIANRDLRVLKEIFEDVILLSGDITDYASVRNVLETVKPVFVFHLAALTPVRDSFERPFEYQEANFLGTMNLIHSMLELPDPQARMLIAASTAEVYGLQEEEMLTEKLALNPSSPYAVGKAAADLYLQMTFRTYGLNGVVLRPTNTYGRKFDTSFLVEYLVTQMLKGQRVFIGAPDSVRDYMYVDDHVNAYLLAMDKKKDAKGQVFNVGTGVGTSNKELAMKIADKVGYDRSKIVLGSYPPSYPYRPLVSDQLRIVLDATWIQEKLGWKPTVSLDEGLDRVISYFESKLP